MLTIASMLEHQAARHGRTLALIDDATGDTWTIAELERASAAARRLNAVVTRTSR